MTWDFPHPTAHVHHRSGPELCRAGGRSTHALGAALGKTLDGDMSQGKHPSQHFVFKVQQKA